MEDSFSTRVVFLGEGYLVASGVIKIGSVVFLDSVSESEKMVEPMDLRRSGSMGLYYGK